MKYHAVVKCQLCDKMGIVEANTNTPLNHQLWGKNINGFTRRNMPSGKSKTVCDSCFTAAGELLDSQQEERAKFMKGKEA